MRKHKKHSLTKMVLAVSVFVLFAPLSVQADKTDEPSNMARLAFQNAAGPVDPNSIEHQRIVVTAVLAAKLKFGGFPNGLIPMEISVTTMPRANILYSDIKFGGKSEHMVLVPYLIGNGKSIIVAVLQADKFKFNEKGEVAGVSSGKEGIYFQPSQDDLPEVFMTSRLVGSEPAKDYHVMIFAIPQGSKTQGLI